MHYVRRLKALQEDLRNVIEVSRLDYYSQITHKLTHTQKNTNDIIKKVFQ